VFGQTPFVVDPQTVYPKSGYQTSDNYGGYNTQTVRGKVLWNALDKLSVTFTADWSHGHRRNPRKGIRTDGRRFGADRFGPSATLWILVGLTLAASLFSLMLSETAPAAIGRRAAKRSNAQRYETDTAT
jgi:hypothetical protein